MKRITFLFLLLASASVALAQTPTYVTTEDLAAALSLIDEVSQDAADSKKSGDRLNANLDSAFKRIEKLEKDCPLPATKPSGKRAVVPTRRAAPAVVLPKDLEPRLATAVRMAQYAEYARLRDLGVPHAEACDRAIAVSRGNIRSENWAQVYGESQKLVPAKTDRLTAIEIRLGTVETTVGGLTTTVADHGTRLGAVEADLKTLQSNLVKVVGNVVTMKLVGYYSKEEADKKITETITEAFNNALKNGLVTEADMSAFVTEALKGYATSKDVAGIREQTLAAIGVVKNIIPHIKMRNIKGDHDKYRRDKIRELTAIERALEAAEATDEAEEVTTPPPVVTPTPKTECPTDDGTGEEVPKFVE